MTMFTSLKLLTKANGMKMMDCTLPHGNGHLGNIFKHDLANQTFLCLVFINYLKYSLSYR